MLGRLTPEYTRGALPVITGYLLWGVVLGPYGTNFISRFYIHLLGRFINRLSLAFIAGSAGAEIYFPELRPLFTPILGQVHAAPRFCAQLSTEHCLRLDTLTSSLQGIR